MRVNRSGPSLLALLLAALPGWVVFADQRDKTALLNNPFSRPDILKPKPAPPQAKLGGTGLGLVALREIQRPRSHAPAFEETDQPRRALVSLEHEIDIDTGPFKLEGPRAVDLG